MSQIRPVSDLRNHFSDISRTVHETSEPVILTKNGYGDMVVLSYDEYEKYQYEMMVAWSFAPLSLNRKQPKNVTPMRM